MKRGIGIFSVLVYSVILLVCYHYALRHFNGKVINAFNYSIIITKCGPVVYDRVDTIEIEVNKLKRKN